MALRDWRSDPGITYVASQYMGSPGPGFQQGGSHVTANMGHLAPYAGYSFRAVRDLFKKRPTAMTQPGRMTMGGPAVGSPTPTGSAPSASNPKRLWNYSFRNMAPFNTTLGRLRNMYSVGRSSSAFFR